MVARSALCQRRAQRLESADEYSSRELDCDRAMDRLTPDERSIRMSLVRSKHNRSTEWRMRSALMRAGISGWGIHPRALSGRPDFFFQNARLVVFVDGCFWHQCPYCKRRPPATNRVYWQKKLLVNARRAKRVNARLRSEGFQVIRIWEHRLRSPSGLSGAISRIRRALDSTRNRRRSETAW